ncbi:MAG: S8 family peptidase [Gemmatimonadetes bacterium]|nr:S8 family peptidase [Gemmatimonadota bacterium]
MPRPALLLLLLVVACSPAATTVTTAPQPAAVPSVSATAPSPAAAADDWQLLDATADGVAGIGLRRAERELLGGRAPLREIVVAVIDGGVDTAHVELKPVLWSNPKEQPGNGRDDDNNGYIDDTRGWNFLGGATGDVNWETLEVTRQHARCLALGTNIADSTRARCAGLATEYTTKRAELQGQAAQVRSVDELMTRTTRTLRSALGADSLTPARVEALVASSDSVRNARSMFLRLAQAGISPEAIADAREQIESQMTYGYNVEFNPRAIVGDNPSDPTERRYGNRNVTGPNAKHGSHVAGIIGAARNGMGIDGVAAGVRIMAVRAVPDGDERDKDVAAAIRYAADNGAHIINMSFGKGLSPDKGVVDEAVRYAAGKGVLLVHAAGNDGADLATEPNFPQPAYTTGGRAETWIEVGASSWKGGEHLAAPFSNYGKEQVDVFAPGEDILSTVPGGGYSRQSGTSMAAPVVSGLAAVLMGHFPSLTAAQVKRIILESATSYKDALVVRPGSQEEKVPFGSLSRTGGIVNAVAAIKAAQAMVRPVP